MRQSEAQQPEACRCNFQRARAANYSWHLYGFNMLCLARTGRAHYGHELVGVQLTRDVLHHHCAFVAATEALPLQHWHAHRFRRPQPRR